MADRKRKSLAGIHPELQEPIQNWLWEQIFRVRLRNTFDHANELLKGQLSPGARCILIQFLERHGRA